MNRYTPETIVKDGKRFSIPIYQRLYEWSKDNVEALLNDLCHAFSVSQKEDYYIGLLTSTINNELVDGQQRFTVMMLLGSVLQQYDEEWKDFLSPEMPRLTFIARDDDQQYLQGIISGHASDAHYVNLKMEECIGFMSSYMNQFQGDKIAFSRFVFHHLAFFIAPLPKDYGPLELNKYFEKMNVSGKNLEQHEILKVKLISKIGGQTPMYMKLWNLISDVDQPLITGDDSEDRKRGVISRHGAVIDAINLIDNFKDGDEQTNGKRITDLEPSAERPKESRPKDHSRRCPLRFPALLIQTLYWFVGHDNVRESLNDFFNPSNLLDTFNHYLPFEGEEVDPEKIKRFIDSLVFCRCVMDTCFVRVTDYGYTLDMCTHEDDDDTHDLLMLESMLLVSSTNYSHYRWFGWIMDYVKAQNNIPSADGLYQELDSKDKFIHKLPQYDALSYNDNTRYWFWRLDLTIWKRRKRIFANDKNLLKVCENYVFLRNRSIEHIAPQTPKSESDMQWDDTPEDTQLRNSFGNLVMISQGLNSALQNESYEIKRAHVEAYYNGSKTGSIESLKLICAYMDYAKWSRDSIIEHGRNMYSLLEDEYNS